MPQLTEAHNPVDELLTTAVQEQQWSLVAELLSQCSGQQRGEVQAVRLGVPPHVTAAVVSAAMGVGEVEVVEEGVEGNACDALCQQAAHWKQWELVTLLGAGVGAEVRRRVLRMAVADRQVMCTASLLTEGVSRQAQEDMVIAIMNTLDAGDEGDEANVDTAHDEDSSWEEEFERDTSEDESDMTTEDESDVIIPDEADVNTAVEADVNTADEADANTADEADDARSVVRSWDAGSVVELVERCLALQDLFIREAVKGQQWQLVSDLVLLDESYQASSLLDYFHNTGQYSASMLYGEPFFEMMLTIICNVDEAICLEWASPLNNWLSEEGLSGSRLQYTCPLYFCTVIERVCGQSEDARAWISEWAGRCWTATYYQMAFLLAFAVEDSDLLDKLCQHCPAAPLKDWVDVAVDRGAFPMAVTLLKHIPMVGARGHTILVDPSLRPLIHLENNRQVLAAQCQDRGLMTWAVIFTMPRLDRLDELFQEIHDQTLLKYVMEGAVMKRQWWFISSHMHKVTDPDSLLYLFRHSLDSNDFDLIGRLLCRTDLNKVVDVAEDLWRAITGWCANDSCYGNHRLLTLCVSAGVMALARDIQEPSCCPLRMALDGWSNRSSPDIATVTLLLQSGAVSYRKLHELRCDQALQQRLATESREGWKQCYRQVVEAASTPLRLEHAAILAVSRAVGCQSERHTRIAALPLPVLLKESLHFKHLTENDSFNKRVLRCLHAGSSTWMDPVTFAQVQENEGLG